MSLEVTNSQIPLDEIVAGDLSAEAQAAFEAIAQVEQDTFQSLIEELAEMSDISAEQVPDLKRNEKIHSMVDGREWGA